MTRDQIKEAETRKEESPKRVAIDSVQPIEETEDLLLMATRPGDAAKITFVAKRRSDGRYDIKTFGGSMKSTNIYVVLDKIKTGKSLKASEVMTSNEVGAHEPMTGDYDLFAVCPSWADYGSGAPTKIHKPGLVMQDPKTQQKTNHPSITFGPGTNMEKVLDPRLHTMGKVGPHHELPISSNWNEHADMGNLTPGCCVASPRSTPPWGRRATRLRAGGSTTTPSPTATTGSAPSPAMRWKGAMKASR